MKRAITRVVVVLTTVLMLSTCTTVPPTEDLFVREAELRPLIEVARKGDTEKVQALLAKGADVNAQNNTGNTALMVAQQKGHKETFQLLTEAGAKE